jgi:hypothetical protein
MCENRRSLNSLIKLSALLIGLSLVTASCAVFTVNKSDLEKKLKSKSEHPNYKGISLKSVSLIKKGKPYNNNIDTLLCVDGTGQLKVKKFNYTSTIRIITKKDKSVKLYAKTLYIWNDQFLVGERVSPSIYGGPNIFPVKLSEISRIEVKP